MRHTRVLAVATLAMLNVFTLAAAAVVAHMLPPRLAKLNIPVAASRPVIAALPVLPAVGLDSTAGSGQAAATAPVPTQAGLASLVATALPYRQVGPGAGVLVADAATGKVLYSRNGYTAATPASTVKVVAAAAALAVMASCSSAAVTRRSR